MTETELNEIEDRLEAFETHVLALIKTHAEDVARLIEPWKDRRASIPTDLYGLRSFVREAPRVTFLDRDWVFGRNIRAESEFGSEVWVTRSHAITGEAPDYAPQLVRIREHFEKADEINREARRIAFEEAKKEFGS